MRHFKSPFLWCVAAAALFNVWFAYTLSGRDSESRRIWYLIDDAMISMSYARTFAQTGELVWYPGADRVEGFTNPLWTMLMVVPHWLGLHGNALILVVMFVGGLCVVGSAAIAFTLTKKLSSLPLAPCAAALAVALTYPLAFWSLRGMEIGVITFASFTLIALAVRPQQNSSVLVAAAVVTFLAVWVRLDFVAVAAALALTSLALTRTERRFWKFSAAVGLGTAAGALSVTAWRLIYYGNATPNTYTLKMTGSSLVERLQRGVLHEFTFTIFFALVVVGATLLWRRAPTQRPLVALLGATTAVTFAYSLYVGGDAWPELTTRYVVPGLAAGTVLAVAGLSRQLAGTRTSPLWVTSVTIIAALATLAATSLPAYSDLLRNGEHTKANEYQDAAWNQKLAEITSEDAVIAVTYAGMGQYLTNRKTIDLLGKMDPVIAAKPRRINFYPGHDKWDIEHSVVGLRPDVVAIAWWPIVPSYPEMVAVGYEILCLPYLHDGEEKQKLILVDKRSPNVERGALVECPT